MSLDLHNHALLVIFIASLLLLLAATESGRFFGARATDKSAGHFGTIESAVLGLLGLLIGFTFAIDVSQFEGRREAVLNEANAIGTTALRARLLPAPYAPKILKLLQDYVQIRLDITQRVVSLQELETAIARSDAIQEALWRETQAVVAKDNAMVPTGLFVQTLNEMIDNQQTRIYAAMKRLPDIVVYGLYGVAAVALGFAGYASGLAAGRSRIPVYFLGLLIAAVMLLIQDIDRPNAGFINVSQRPMIDTAKSIAAYTE